MTAKEFKEWMFDNDFVVSPRLFIQDEIYNFDTVHKIAQEYAESQNKELIELHEILRDQIINAFRAGRKAGAIFKTQRDAEGLAERYLRDLTLKTTEEK